MADVMEERVHSIERSAGFGFVLAAAILSLSLLLHPTFPDVNRTNLVLQAITRSRGESWMQLHAVMAAGFGIAAVAFCALAFLLHIRGSSGSAAVVSTCAVLGAAIWVTFLSAELYAYRFFANLYGIDPGGATMLFSTVWFWKLGALYAGGILFFVAVLFSGLTGFKRDVLPLWLGWGGALFALIGLLIYVMDFWSSTATGTASQPMQWPAMRYGVGLPLQIWMLGVGVVFLRRYFTRPMAMRAAPSRPASAPSSRRPAEPAVPAAAVESPRPAPPRVPHPALAPEPESPPKPPPPRVPHPALAPEPEPESPPRPPPPQIYPG